MDIQRATKVYKTLDQTEDKEHNDSSKKTSQFYNGYPNYANNTNQTLQSNASMSRICNIPQGMNLAMNKFREKNKVIDVSIGEGKNGELLLVKLYDDGTYSVPCKFFSDRGPLKIITACLMDKKYKFVVLSAGDQVVYSEDVSKVSVNKVYDALLQAGFQFYPFNNSNKAKSAIFNYVMKKAKYHTEPILSAGYSGWVDKKYKVAQDFGYIQKFKHSLNIPVLNKEFDRSSGDMHMSIEAYKNYMLRVKDLKIRVWLSITPFSGLLFSLMKECKKHVPYVINFVLLSKEVKIAELTEYLQIFNRKKAIQAFNLGVNDKALKSYLDDSKDEVLVFDGVLDHLDSDYFNQKITRNMNKVAQIGLERSGSDRGYINKSAIAIISDQCINQFGTKNIFVQDLFEYPYEDDYDALEATWALFLNYIEYCYDTVSQLIKSNIDAETRVEAYWRIILKILDNFFKLYSGSFTEVLALPEEFTFDFLWEEDDDFMEDGVATVVKAVRRSMPSINAVERSYALGGESFLYDRDSIWISPKLFSEILEDSGLGLYKESLLFRCKEEGLLKTSNYGGYTTRLQANRVRKEYYRFDRDCFTKTGEIELINLAGGE